MLAGLGYFFVWALLGLAVFPVGVGMATIAMAWPALARIVPAGAGMIVLIAGALQCTKWKARHLALCRNATVRLHRVADRDGAAWRLGLHIGLHCGLSCANLTAILLVTGVMDLRVMALITAAITAERLAPAGLLVAQSIGLLAVGAGLVSIASAL
jgi:predicted metal-binding membrane protein